MFNPFKSLIRKIKHKKGQRYDHIASIGYNCEPVYKIVQYFDFEESSLFNWTLTYSNASLIYAIDNIEKLGTQGFNGPLPFWNCKFSGLYFHTKREPEDLAQDPDLAAIDEKELGEKVQYLAQKFLRILRSDDRKLYIRKMQSADINENANEKIEAIRQALLAKGGKNFDILVVSEEKDKHFFQNPVNYIYRSIKFYTPDYDVTDRKSRNNGWDKIFDEFYVEKPENTVKKDYKYERKH